LVKIEFCFRDDRRRKKDIERKKRADKCTDKLDKIRCTKKFIFFEITRRYLNITKYNKI